MKNENVNNEVFRGIELIYTDISNDVEPILKKYENKRVLRIDHCREGRVERSVGEEFFYLEKGDMAVTSLKERENSNFYPNNDYYGITILIDIDTAPKCLSCLLDDVNVKPEKLFDKFCVERECFISRSSDSIEHIFAELYSVNENVRTGYTKIKVLELMLFLSCTDTEQKEKKSYDPAQVELAKNTSIYISEHLAEKITLNDITCRFHVSPTNLKNCFKGVYGVSVSAYIRSRKMQAAAQLLRTTDETVLGISNRFGYDNGSKFASAFYKVTGKTPNEYRTEHREEVHFE